MAKIDNDKSRLLDSGGSFQNLLDLIDVLGIMNVLYTLIIAWP
jgi:hypothetical protein